MHEDRQLDARLASIEALLSQLLRETRARRRSASRRRATVSDRAVLAAMGDTEFKPNELQIAAARRALRRGRR
jgi:hypothetical protein